VYRVADGAFEGLAVAFRTSSGGVEGMAMSGLTQDPVSFQRLPWWRSGKLHAIMIVLAYVTIASWSVAAAMAALIRRIRGRRRAWEPTNGSARTVGLTGSAVLTAAPLMALAVLIGTGGDDPTSGNVHRALWVLTMGLFVGTTLASAGSVFSVRAWRERLWSPPARFHFMLVSLSGAVLMVMLAWYHLLGPGWM
jgi:hypothetical protein